MTSLPFHRRQIFPANDYRPGDGSNQMRPAPCYPRQPSLKIGCQPDVNRLFSAGFFENPKKYVRLQEDFSLEKGILTQTMKLKRLSVLDPYQDQLQALYS